MSWRHCVAALTCVQTWCKDFALNKVVIILQILCGVSIYWRCILVFYCEMLNFIRYNNKIYFNFMELSCFKWSLPCCLPPQCPADLPSSVCLSLWIWKVWGSWLVHAPPLQAWSIVTLGLPVQTGNRCSCTLDHQPGYDIPGCVISWTVHI